MLLFINDKQGSTQSNFPMNCIMNCTRRKKTCSNCATVEELFNPLLDVLVVENKSKMCHHTMTKTSVAHRKIKEHGKRKEVRYNDDFEVISIPSRKDYSEEEREAIWTSSEELNRMIYKGSIEFRYEGQNWRNVVVEKDMYRSKRSGDLVHPAIVLRAMHLQELHMSAKQRLMVGLYSNKERKRSICETQLPLE